jgi:hypothetical protein
MHDFSQPAVAMFKQEKMIFLRVEYRGSLKKMSDSVDLILYDDILLSSIRKQQSSLFETVRESLMEI